MLGRWTERGGDSGRGTGAGAGTAGCGIGAGAGAQAGGGAIGTGRGEGTGALNSGSAGRAGAFGSATGTGTLMEGSVLLLEAGQQGLPPAFHILKGLGNRFRLAQEEVGLLQRLLQGLLQGRQDAAQLGAGGLQILQDAGSLFPEAAACEERRRAKASVSSPAIRTILPALSQAMP